MIVAHSGALAGEDGAYEALFEAHGVLRVDSLDEMADTLELLVAGRRAGPGGLAAIHDSGGERALLVDAAEANGVPLAQIGPETVARLAAVLEEGLPPVNPLDAWGTGNRAEDIFIECMRALLDDPDSAALAFCVDLTPELVEDAGYTRVADEVFAATGKPVAVLSNLASAIDRRDATFVRGKGIPVLEGTNTGLRAFRHLFEYRDFQARPAGPAVHGRYAPIGGRPPREIHGLEASAVEWWRERLRRADGPLPEMESLALIGDFGVPVIGSTGAASLDAALEAARNTGFPVALKTATAGIAHKSDAGGVVLGIDHEEAFAHAYRDISERLGPQVIVAKMAEPGVEVALGIVRDDQFGPLVVVAAGGTLIEILNDRAMLLPPIDRSAALRALARLSISPLLDGYRGHPPVERARVADAIERLGMIALAFADEIAALDVNPLIAAATGCVAVDALVIPA
jgi:acyl-CoA synthetase (NDP forming)